MRSAQWPTQILHYNYNYYYDVSWQSNSKVHLGEKGSENIQADI